jgi:hypothetical protein
MALPNHEQVVPLCLLNQNLNGTSNPLLLATIQSHRLTALPKRDQNLVDQRIGGLKDCRVALLLESSGPQGNRFWSSQVRNIDDSQADKCRSMPLCQSDR